MNDRSYTIEELIGKQTLKLFCILPYLEQFVGIFAINIKFKMLF